MNYNPSNHKVDILWKVFFKGNMIAELMASIVYKRILYSRPYRLMNERPLFELPKGYLIMIKEDVTILELPDDTPEYMIEEIANYVQLKH